MARTANDISLLVKAAVQLEKDEALRLERQLQEVGRDAAQGMSRNFTKEFEKQLGVESKVSRHRATAALNSATRLAEIEEKLDDTRQSLQVATVLVTDAEREKTRVMEDSTSTVEDQERATRALADANDNLRRIQSDVITLQHRRIKADRDVMRQSEDLKDTLDNQTVSVGQGLLTIGKYVSALRAIAIPAAAVGAIGLGAQIAGAVAAMSKSFLLIPGAVTGAVAGMGAMSVATMGFGDALKDIGDPAKFAEGLQKLSPNAQQAALSIQAIMPALSELKNATQDALFADGATMINQLANEYLPQIKQMMTQIAGAFNQAFRGIFDELMSPDGIATVDRILNNIGQAFQNLAPAARPFTEALLKLSDVGAGLLPEIATAAAHAANSFANFIREASESGKLEEWLRQGLDAVNSFMDGVYELGRMFFALGENGNTTLEGLRDDLKAFADDFDKVANALDKISVGFGKANALIETFKSLTKAATQTLEFFYEGFRKVFNMIPLVPDLPSFDDAAKGTGFGLGTFIKPFVFGNQIPLADIGKNAFKSGAQVPTSPGPGISGVGGLADLLGLPPGSAAPPPAPAPGSAGLPGVPAGGYPVPAPPPDKGSGGGGMQDAFFDPSLWQVGDSMIPVDALPGGMASPSGLQPNAANLNDIISAMFPMMPSAGGWRPPDGFNEHSSGEAVDFMTGGDFALGDAINAFILQNAEALGVQYTIWRQMMHYADGRTSLMEDRGSPTQNHMDHVHARVNAGPASAAGLAFPGAGAGGMAAGMMGGYVVDPEAVMRAEAARLTAKNDLEQKRLRLLELQAKGDATQRELLTAQNDVAEAERRFNIALLDEQQARRGKYKELDGQINSAANSIGQIGAALANDFGISEGLPGIAKWLTTFMANLAFAPAIGALSAVTAMSPIQGGYGMMGMMGANAMASGTYPGMGVPMMGVPGLGVPGMGVPGAAAIGPAPLGGGLGAGLTPGLMTPATPGVGTGPLPGPPGGGMGTGGMGGLPGGAPPRMLTPQMGRAPSPGTGGGFQGFGGSGFGALAMQGIQAGLSGAGMAADLMGAGGAGTLAAQAAQTGIELANRTAGYLGQLGGITVGGLLETFVPNSSEAGDPSKSWFGRIAAGIAGARPALPNTAGGSAPAQPPQAQQKNGQQGPAGPLVSVGSINNYTPDGGNDLARSIARLSYSGYKSGGPGPR